MHITFARLKQPVTRRHGIRFADESPVADNNSGSWRWILQDIRSSIRQLYANPGFTLIVVLTLAIGIAANTTIFSWIDNVLVHPIPGVADPKELVCFETIARNGEHLTVSYPASRNFRG